MIWYVIENKLHASNQAEEITSVYHSWERDILLSWQISPSEVGSTGVKCQAVSSWTLVRLILQISLSEPGGWAEGKGAQTHSKVAQCQGQETLALLKGFKWKSPLNLQALQLHSQPQMEEAGESLRKNSRKSQAGAEVRVFAQMATSIVKRTIHGRGLALTFFSMKGNAWRRLGRMIPQY